MYLEWWCFAFLCHSKTLEDTALVQNPRPFGQHCYNLKKYRIIYCDIANGLVGSYDENLNIYVIAWTTLETCWLCPLSCWKICSWGEEDCMFLKLVQEKIRVICVPFMYLTITPNKWSVNSELGVVASSVVLPCQLSGRTGTPTGLTARDLNVGFLQYKAGVFLQR